MQQSWAKQRAQRPYHAAALTRLADQGLESKLAEVAGDGPTAARILSRSNVVHFGDHVASWQRTFALRLASEVASNVEHASVAAARVPLVGHMLQRSENGVLTRSGHGRCEGLGPRISTRFRHGDTYEVRTAWNRRVFVHRAPTRRSVKRAVHLGLRRFRGGHFARVSPIERMFWSWLPILPAPPVSTRCDPTTHSPISDLINM